MCLYLVYGHVDDDDDQGFGRGVGEGGQCRGDGGEDRTEEWHYLQDTGQNGEGESVLYVEGSEARPQVRAKISTIAAIWPMIQPETRSLISVRISSTLPRF